jgi:hypothetical protein
MSVYGAEMTDFNDLAVGTEFGFFPGNRSVYRKTDVDACIGIDESLLNQPMVPRPTWIKIHETQPRFIVENSTNKYHLRDLKTGQIVFYDGGEPEDQTLIRDLRDLVDLLNKVARGG